ncbi:hotdog family protein [Pasteurella atlantica]|uniref:Hotdog family protein n=2 Tax=Pasteurellaceae TaxID=712 RepID=A0ACC6HK31_9PAST|nr:hotdog family protein [Pasteurella atlantica]MDP8033777.1 hotdog family protein [Pasteurella atlantica]MDP8035712.1 hotdog family protein [Pasteurella atlantica]MDP8037607.1 hotdog family protein [Pasteurella atlantica]MDP8048012.1 hotdog family protein [Pasteurella atlantica]MDP8049967.1 hotdog family protein [Pasteurella atlantica]
MTKLNCPIYDVEPLLPHSGEMVLLDKICDFGDDFIIAESTIKADNLLIKHNQFATYSGIEIMAQTVGAWSGCMSTLANEPVRLGYLLGTRKLTIHSQEIAIGTTLIIKAKMSIQDATGFSVFDCKLIDKKTNQVLLEAALNVFSPKE